MHRVLRLEQQLCGGSSLIVRGLEPGDYDKGYLQLLGQLTRVEHVERRVFEQRLERMSADTYKIAVIEDVSKGKIVAAATLFVELKFIRGCAICGHIEDVVVDETYRGQNLGLKIIGQLKTWAKEAGCYKVILDCGEHNVAFYNKLGFQKKEVQMACYFQ